MLVPPLFLSSIHFRSMSLYKTFGTDPSKEKSGVWIDLCVNDDDTVARMKILRMGASNKNFTREYAAIQRNRGGKRTPDPELELSNLREVFCNHVLIDWENVYPEKPNVDGKFEPIPFSKDAAKKLFAELPELFDMVTTEATKLENFQAEEMEADAKK